MAGEKVYATLGDHVKLQRGKTYKSQLKGTPGPYLLGLASIQRNGGFRGDNLTTYGGESPENLLLRPGDLYASLKDVTQSADLLGAVARVPPRIALGRLTQDTVKLVFKNSTTSPDYVYWILRTPQYRAYCLSHATGTTNLGLSREDFLSFPIPEPTSDRLRLVALLGTLDDKIELNRRMNETLEAIARALFKSWFVDFDPVRAKMEGRKPAGMDNATAALFPDSFQDSPLGEIPKGWRVAEVGDIVHAVGGGTPSTAQPAYWHGGIHHFATPKDLAGLSCPILLDTERKVTEAGLATISSGLLPAGTLLLSSRAPVGYLAISQMPVAVNQGFIAMKCDKSLSAYFMLNWARFSMDEIERRASGTTFPEISKQNFRPIPIVVPSPTVVSVFDSAVRALFDQVVTSLRQSNSLAALRDALLPKLLSGEIRVSEAEGIVRRKP